MHYLEGIYPTDLVTVMGVRAAQHCEEEPQGQL